VKTPDLDRQRSERKIPLTDFLTCYNEGLPPEFPRASLALLKEFKRVYPTHFKDDGLWSLDAHRKRVMDWLPAHLKSLVA